MDIYKDLLMGNLVHDYEDDVSIFISCEDSENFYFKFLESCHDSGEIWEKHHKISHEEKEHK